MTHHRDKSGQPPYMPPAGGYAPNHGPAWDSHFMMPVYGPYPGHPPWSYSFPPYHPGHFQPCNNCPYRLNRSQQPYPAAQEQQSHIPQQHLSNNQVSQKKNYPVQPKKKTQKGAISQVENESMQLPETKIPKYKIWTHPGSD